MEKEEKIKSLRFKSIIGLVLFSLSIVFAYFYLNNAILGLISIIGMTSGWFIFSKNHTEITSLKIKAITEEYLREKFEK